MRHPLILGLALIISSAFLTANARCEDSKTSEGKMSPLSVALEIVSQRYYRSSHNDYLRVTCQVQFTNTGNEPLILQKRIGTVGSMKVIKESTKSDPNRHILWNDVEIEHRGESGKIRNLQIPNTDEFVILKTGQSFKIQSRFVLSRERGDARFNSIFGPGEYAITAEIETWTGSQDVGTMLSDRWKKWGRLWHETFVTAEPMHVIIPENPRIEDCTRED